MTAKNASAYRQLREGLRTGIQRTPENLVPPAFRYLLAPGSTYYCASGGRMSGKSWSVARVLLLFGMERSERVLCCREMQNSLMESAYRLFVDQIQTLGLEDFYNIQSDRIIGKNGTVFFFEGLRYNAQKLKSYERITLVWVEEAQTVSDMSWELLIPTVMRNRGARFFITWNPLTKDDPVQKRFVDSGRTDVAHRHSTFRDNPHLPPEALTEKDWLQRTDVDAYRHVWEGEPRTISEALIFRDRYEVLEFEVAA